MLHSKERKEIASVASKKLVYCRLKTPFLPVCAGFLRYESLSHWINYRYTFKGTTGSLTTVCKHWFELWKVLNSIWSFWDVFENYLEIKKRKHKIPVPGIRQDTYSRDVSNNPLKWRPALVFTFCLFPLITAYSSINPHYIRISHLYSGAVLQEQKTY